MQNYFYYFFKKLEKMIGRKSRKAIINDIIDVVFHPLFGKYLGIPEVVDFIFHCLNEGEIDMKKFVRYNLPTALASILNAVIEFLEEAGFYEKKYGKRV